jgi:hypothetical protein
MTDTTTTSTLLPEPAAVGARASSPRCGAVTCMTGMSGIRPEGAVRGVTWAKPAGLERQCRWSSAGAKAVDQAP